MVLKCKMCGGDVKIIEGTNTGKCLYCKSVMTLPNINNNKIINLYNRANDLRIANEFDKSEEIYEDILKVDNEQVEAHWGVVLCKYGVEYIDDPRTKKKVPTCHRTIPESILNNSDYKFIKSNATKDALELYEKEAAQISKIQKRILEISNKEDPYDIFICYKETDEKDERTHDSVIAQDIYEALIKEGYKVFFSKITLEDKLGTEYEPYIYSALTSARIMLVVGTSEKNLESVWVKNEWSRYLEFMKKDRNKILIPVYSKMNPYNLPLEFSSLQAQSMDKIGSMQDLVRGVKKILAKPKNSNSELERKIEEASDGVKDLGDNRYEITKLKEKLPLGYFWIVIVLIILIISLKLLLIKNGMYTSTMESYNFIGDRSSHFGSFVSKYQFMAALFVIIAGIMKLCPKKIRRLSDVFIIATIIAEIIPIFICYTISVLPTMYYFFLILLELFLYFINPSWHLDTSSKIIVNKKEKDKILNSNKTIRKNFKQKQPRLKPIYFIIIIAALSLSSGILIFNLAKNPSNGRNKKVDQIKIIDDSLQFFSDSDCNPMNPDDIDETGDCKKFGKLKKGEIYTVLDEEYTGDSVGIKYRNYYIQNKLGVRGWVNGVYDIYRKDGPIKYVEFLKKEK